MNKIKYILRGHSCLFIRKFFLQKLEGKVARLPVAGEAFESIIINIRCVLYCFILSDALSYCFRCIEHLKCSQAQEGDDDEFEEHLHLHILDLAFNNVKPGKTILLAAAS